MLYLDCIKFLSIFKKKTFHCGYEKRYFSYMYIKHPVTVYTLKCREAVKIYIVNLSRVTSLLAWVTWKGSYQKVTCDLCDTVKARGSLIDPGDKTLSQFCIGKPIIIF